MFPLELKSQNCTKTAWDAVIQPTDIIIWQTHSCSRYRSIQLLDASDCVNVVLQRVLSRSHTFSMMFKSGDCAGHESDFVSFLSLYSMTERAL